MARTTRRGRPPHGGRPVWLEIRGRQRLERLQARLELRRQRLQRWSALVDHLEQEVLDRLEEVGGGAASEGGYDAAATTVSGRRTRRNTRTRVAGSEDADDDVVLGEVLEEVDEVAGVAVETYYDDGEWKSRRQGSSRAFSVGGTKAEQVAKGRDAARKDEVEHIIKNRDGTISARNSYGNDPNPPRDED